MPRINIQTDRAPAPTREHINNHSMLAPAPTLDDGLVLRPMSLGSLEILRQLGNPMASADASPDAIDTRAMTEFVWVHAAPLEEVVDTVYNHPSDVARVATTFALRVSTSQLTDIAAILKNDRDAVSQASAAPIHDDDLPESKNALAPRQ